MEIPPPKLLSFLKPPPELLSFVEPPPELISFVFLEIPPPKLLVPGLQRYLIKLWSSLFLICLLMNVDSWCTLLTPWLLQLSIGLDSTKLQSEIIYSLIMSYWYTIVVLYLLINLRGLGRKEAKILIKAEEIEGISVWSKTENLLLILGLWNRYVSLSVSLCTLLVVIVWWGTVRLCMTVDCENLIIVLVWQ